MAAPPLVLHQHPFASFCQKPLIALYELGLPFTSRLVGDEASRRELVALWPMAKMPVLRDEAAGLTVPESTPIIEYLDALAPSGPRLIPDDRGAARRVRLWDRFFDLYVQLPMQKIVGDALRPDGAGDPTGVAEAHGTLVSAYAVLDLQLAGPWAAGPTFSLADCAAAPALFYARVVHPWSDLELPELTRYYGDLMHRPSVARVVDEARPYRELFPLPWPSWVDDHLPAPRDRPGAANA
jgi:glutathione S-transferase